MQHMHMKEISFFRGLDHDELQQLEASMDSETFPGNSTIFWAGDCGTDFFILKSGTVQLSLQDETGTEQPLATLGPGDYFGELSLLDGGPRTATCRTITPVEVLKLSRHAFLDFLREKPDAALHVLETISRRQRDTLAQLRRVRNANEAIQEETRDGPLWPRIADKIAAISASQQFLLFHIAWFGTWISTNLLLGDKAFDPLPFGLLTMSVSLEAIFLSIFVLVSANRQGDRDRIRADVDHQVNLKAHQELLELHRKLEKLAEQQRGASLP